MKFNFTNLDDQTRKLIKDEIARATKNDEIYFSARLNNIGSGRWVHGSLRPPRLMMNTGSRTKSKHRRE